MTNPKDAFYEKASPTLQRFTPAPDLLWIGPYGMAWYAAVT
jgi:hypothetical protein